MAPLPRTRMPPGTEEEAALPAGTGPHRVFAAARPWPLHDLAATRTAEAAALKRTVPHALMARAGLGVARLARAVVPHARRVTALVGPGNNGGDALVAALHLMRAGVQVEALALADPARLPGDAADAWQQAQAAGLPIALDAAAFARARLQRSELILDGLLGLGATRAPEGAIADAIAAANASGRPILAIDLPSGLSADHGRVLGEQAIRARWTLSLLALKPGLFTGAGRDHAGDPWFDDLGVSDAGAASAWLSSWRAPPPPGFAVRQHRQHKGSFGDLFVVGGAPGMHGAAELAAHAALTAGAGRVYLSPLDPALAPQRPELMTAPRIWNDGAERLPNATVVCGCGGGSHIAQVLPALLAHVGRLVIDADGLNALAREPALTAALRARAAGGRPTILTPHPLEAARLLGMSAAQVQADRLAAARQLADASAAVVVLKGSGSVIAAPGRTPWINASGNAALATPGSGDVLAGWIGGLWACQGPDDDGWASACRSVWLHGRAADLALADHPGHAHLPLRAGDLADAMTAALDDSANSAAHSLA